MQYHTEWKSTQHWKTHWQAQNLLFSEKPTIRKLEGFHWWRWEERPWRGPSLPILTPPFTISKIGQGTASKDSFQSVGTVEMDIVFQNFTAFSFITLLVSKIKPLFSVFQFILFYAQWWGQYAEAIWRQLPKSRLALNVFSEGLTAKSTYFGCHYTSLVPLSDVWISVYLIWF